VVHQWLGGFVSGALAAMSSGPPGVLAGGGVGGTDATSVVVGWGNDGVLTIVLGVTPSNSNWVTPANATVAAYYEIFFHTDSGTLSAGSSTQDTWLPLSSSASLLKTEDGAVSGTYSIREAATGIVRVSSEAWALTNS
jgi:hypothetical protein